MLRFTISYWVSAFRTEFQHFVLSFSISYWDLIKFPYFTDTTKRGVREWKEAQRQGDFTDMSIISSKVPPRFFCPLRFTRFPSGCVSSGACLRACWWWGAGAAASDDGHRCWPFPGAEHCRRISVSILGRCSSAMRFAQFATNFAVGFCCWWELQQQEESLQSIFHFFFFFFFFFSRCNDRIVATFSSPATMQGETSSTGASKADSFFVSSL